MKKYLGLLSIILLVVIATLFSRRGMQPNVVHFHAGFHVYINGVLQDYSDQRYMSLVPCGVVSANPQTEQLEKAHLHEQIGDVVHVHRETATWADLFKNMQVTFDPTLQIVGYVNGKQIPHILAQKIHPYESLILFVGSHGPIGDYIASAVTRAHIMTIEHHSESCGSGS